MGPALETDGSTLRNVMWHRGSLKADTAALFRAGGWGPGPGALAWASSQNRPSGGFRHSEDGNQPDLQGLKDPAEGWHPFWE